MGDVVNLNKFRKRKTRADREKRAEENRAKHGRTKGEKSRDAAEDAAKERLLDGAKIDRDGEE